MSLSKRLMVIILVTLVCAGCDQGTKTLASDFLPKSHMVSYLYDTMRVGYIENTGAFLGLGSQLPESVRFWIFTVFSSAMLAGVLLYALNTQISLQSRLGLSLIIGGGASNLYDRVFNEGAVIDFLNVGFGTFRTGIFNVADVALMLGMAIFVYWQYKDNGNEGVIQNR